MWGGLVVVRWVRARVCLCLGGSPVSVLGLGVFVLGVGVFSGLLLPFGSPFPLVPSVWSQPSVFVSQDSFCSSCLRLSRLPVSESLRIAVFSVFVASLRCLAF